MAHTENPAARAALTGLGSDLRWPAEVFRIRKSPKAQSQTIAGVTRHVRAAETAMVAVLWALVRAAKSGAS